MDHRMNYRVSYADTDRMDRVYYANYLVFCERARTELLRDVGFPYRKVEEMGFLFPVRRCQIRYMGFAEYDDLLTFSTQVTRLSHATLTFATNIIRIPAEKPLVRAEVELACLSASGKPTPIPHDLREALAPYLDAGAD